MYSFTQFLCYVPVKSKLQHPPRAYPGHLTSLVLISRIGRSNRKFETLNMYSFNSPNRNVEGDDCWLVNKAKQLLWQNDLLLYTPGEITEEKSQIRNNADKEKKANVIDRLSIRIFWSQNCNLCKKLRLKYTQRKRQKGKRLLLTL